jgi:hypothetical protein
VEGRITGAVSWRRGEGETEGKGEFYFIYFSGYPVPVDGPPANHIYPGRLKLIYLLPGLICIIIILMLTALLFLLPK